jgi:tRNA pseudouridine55 synthase
LDTHAKTDALDHLILPLEAGLIDLPRVHCPESSVAKLRNGNPASSWATSNTERNVGLTAGQAIAVGTFKSGETPTRVFVRA